MIPLATTATSEKEARFLTASVRLLARFNASGTPIKRVAVRGTVIGITPNGALVVPAPADYVSWTEKISGFAARPDLKAAPRGIRLTGKMSKPAQQGFSKLGWSIQEVSSN